VGWGCGIPGPQVRGTGGTQLVDAVHCVRARSAGIAGGYALLPAPLEGEKGEVAELDDPGYGVSGYDELMID
jgi:hypothetical protein